MTDERRPSMESSRRGSKSPRGGPKKGVLEYDVQQDVERLAKHFLDKYGSLAKAVEHLDIATEFDYLGFEVLLKKWGVKAHVTDSMELFDHIDVDWSGTISVQEIFEVLHMPLENLQARRLQRFENEENRIYEELARSIRDKYGSIEEFFAKGGQGAGAVWQEGEKGVNVYKFGQLVKKLDLEINKAQLQRVFHKVDKDGEGHISLKELERALANYVAQNALVEIAHILKGRGDSLAEPFRALDMTADKEVSEDRFLRILREVKVLEELTEANAKTIYASIQPFNMESFVARLEEEYQRDEEKEQKKRLEAERLAREDQKLLKEATHFDDGTKARQRVKSWARSAADPAKRDWLGAEEVTRGCLARARAGAATTQLKDYVAALQEHLRGQELVVERQRQQLESESRELEEALRDGTSMEGPWRIDSPGSAASAPAAPRRQAAGVSPMISPKLSPRGRAPLMEGAAEEQSKAVRAERLLQAASAGNLPALARCLARNADPDIVGWGGVTALMAAARHGRQAALEELLACGAEVNRMDMRGRTAVDHAHQHPHLRSWLRAHGGLSARELAEEAEALALAVLEREAEHSRLSERLAELPSMEFFREARSRQMRRAGTVPVDLAAAAPSMEPLSRGASAPDPSSLAAGLAPPGVGALRHSQGKQLQVQLRLPVDARGHPSGRYA